MIDFSQELVRFLQQTQEVSIDSPKQISALWRKAKSLAKATNKSDPLLWLSTRLEIEHEALQDWDLEGMEYPIERDAAITDCLVQIYEILPQLAEKLSNLKEDAISLPPLENIFLKSDQFYHNLANSPN